MSHQSQASSGASESYEAEILELILGLPEPRADDWMDYGALGIRPAHESELIRIATDLALLDADQDSPESWAPIHAARSLGKLRSARAVTPLLEALSSGGLFDDWLMQDLPDVFGAIGSTAVDPLVAFAADRSRDLYARMTAVDGLGHVGRRHEGAGTRASTA